MEKKILYVDDEEQQRVAVKKFLSLLGYKAEVYGSPFEALNALKKEDFPLIITDLEMPDMDGIKLCEQIRKIRPDAVIYALSGFVSEFGPDRLEQIGFDGHLCKPVDTKKFEKAIEGAFDKMERQQRLSAKKVSGASPQADV